MPVYKSLKSDTNSIDSAEGHILLKIGKVALSTGSLEALYSALHRLIESEMYAKNFYIALIDDDANQVTIPYFVDEKFHTTPKAQPINLFEKSLTGYVLRMQKLVWLDRVEQVRLQEQGEIVIKGEIGFQWLGVPLKVNNRLFGVMVVQSYNEEYKYSEQDRNILEFVAQNISHVLARQQEQKNAHAKLEEEVRLRTQELSKQVAISERSKNIQNALYEIANLTNTVDDLDEFYSELHVITGRLIYAKNFYIATVDFEHNMLRFPYYFDEYDSGKERPLDLENPKGLTEKVLISKKPLLIQVRDIDHFDRFGHDANAWIGVPLLDPSGNAIGVLAVQSHDPKISYTNDDKDLMDFISNHISTALMRKNSEKKLKEAQAELIDAAHQDGMSEIATGILHELGNIVNSVLTSAYGLRRFNDNSKVTSLVNLNKYLKEKNNEWTVFLQLIQMGEKY